MPKLRTANIATQPSRVNTLAVTIKSIEDQFDIIRVCCNEFKKVPAWLEGHPKVDAFIPPFNLTDNGKFLFLFKGMEPEYYFTLDDDIKYPPDYVYKTVKRIEEFGCIVSYHGRLLCGLNRNYYRQHDFYHCVREQAGNIEIDVCGTGVTAFDTSTFNPHKLWRAEDQRMSDLIFSLEAAKADRIIGCFERPALWIQALEVKDSIFDRFNRRPINRQNEIADEIFKIKYPDKLA